MNQYNIFCTEAQTKKALELGAPIKIEEDKFCSVAINPTTDQMIGWLEERGVHISVIYDDCTYKPEVRDLYDGFINNDEYLSSRKEATIAAIDAAFEYIENL